MKIIALVTDAFGVSGGIAQYNRDFLTALAMQTDIDTIKVLPRNGVPAQAPDNIEQLPSQQSTWLYAFISLWRAVKYKPDLIFCGHLNFLPLAWLISKLVNVPIWLQLHGIDAWERPNDLTARLAEKVNLVTCVSRYTRRKFLSWSNIYPSHVKVLPNTVPEFIGNQPDPALVESLGIKGKKTLLTVGRLSASECYKGHDRIIACLPQLLKQIPNLCYLVAGDGDDRARLEGMVAQNSVSSSVKFLGKISNEQLSDLYQVIDLFAMPSTGEGFGIVFLEAMAAGTPVLGLDRDGSVDPLQDGNLGTVATEENLCEVLFNTLNASPSKNIADRVQDIFGQKRFQNQIQQLLQTKCLQVNN